VSAARLSSLLFFAVPLVACGAKRAPVDPDASSGEPRAETIDPENVPRLHDEIWRALTHQDESLLGEALTVLRHPDADLSGDEPLPTFSHHCGDEARRVGLPFLDVSPGVDDWQCEELQCSYHLDHGARAVFVFRLDASGRPKLWVVGEDYEWDGDIPSFSLLHEAVRRAQQHRCP
jgi:hypothetical protein